MTKWDLISADQRAALEATPYGGNGCSRCGASFATEADFARHYIVPDARYLNLGYCPTRDPKTYPTDWNRF